MRRWLISCALAVFLVVATVYLFWIPYDPAGLYRAIPADAVLVSSHQNLAERWPRLVTNIWLNPFLGEEGTLSYSNAPHSVAQLMRLARRDTLLAYLPAPGGAGKPAWMAVAWIGGWSPCVRWALYWGRWPAIKELGALGGRTMWSLQKPLPDGQRLSFACGDGVFLACLSSDSAAIRYVLMAYDGLIPSTQARFALPPMPESLCQDVVWCQWRNSTSRQPFTLTGALTRFDDHGLSATMRLRPSPCRQARLAESVNVTAVEKLLGDLPALVVALPLTTLQDGLLAAAIAPAWLQTTSRILQSDWIQPDTNGLVLALLTGEYGGGYGRKPLRMSIPALMAFIRVKQPESISRIIDREFDIINARHRLGLIQDPSRMTVGAQTISTIEITGNKLSAALEAEDRPAYTLVGDWLIISSQAGSLAKMMQRFQTPDNETPLMPGGWRGALSATNTAGLAWLDLDAGGKTIQLALSLWGLSQRTADTPSMPRAIKSARTLLERIRPLQSCSLWIEQDGSNTIVRLEIGPRSQP